MNLRKIGVFVFGIVTLILIGFTIYKIASGEVVGFNQISSIGIVMIAFFSAINWGSKEKKDGILQKEELEEKITEESSKISYLLLTIFIFVTALFENYLNDKSTIGLLVLLVLSMITLPFVEFLVSKKHQ